MTPPPVPPEKDIYTDNNPRPHVVPHGTASAATSSSTPARTQTTRSAFSSIMIYGSAALLALATVLYYHPQAQVRAWTDADVPAQAQRIYPKSFAVLDTVLPPSQANISTVSTATQRGCAAHDSNSSHRGIHSISSRRSLSTCTTRSFTPSSDPIPLSL